MHTEPHPNIEIIRAHILDLMSEVPPSRTSPCTVMGHLGNSTVRSTFHRTTLQCCLLIGTKYPKFPVHAAIAGSMLRTRTKSRIEPWLIMVGGAQVADLS